MEDSNPRVQCQLPFEKSKLTTTRGYEKLLDLVEPIGLPFQTLMADYIGSLALALTLDPLIRFTLYLGR